VQIGPSILKTVWPCAFLILNNGLNNDLKNEI
jgi:hypothetical protein